MTSDPVAQASFGSGHFKMLIDDMPRGLPLIGFRFWTLQRKLTI